VTCLQEQQEHFGLAWYQSDIEIPRHRDRGHVRISTILLDQIFGFDPDVSLPPDQHFHLGFWFNNPEMLRPVVLTSTRRRLSTGAQGTVCHDQPA